MNIDSLKNVSNPGEMVSKPKVVEQKPVKQIKAEAKMDTRNKLDTDKEVKDIMNEDLMKKSVKQANVALKQYHRRIDRSVHEVTKTVMYKMIDTETKEVVKEFPIRKIQDMIAKMWELAGLFVDEQI